MSLCLQVHSCGWGTQMWLDNSISLKSAHSNSMHQFLGMSFWSFQQTALPPLTCAFHWFVSHLINSCNYLTSRISLSGLGSKHNQLLVKCVAQQAEPEGSLPGRWAQAVSGADQRVSQRGAGFTVVWQRCLREASLSLTFRVRGICSKP